MYHHVGIHTESLGHRRLWISPERFEEQVSYLFHSGYLSLTLRDAAVRIRERRGAPRAVVLTFDDGYKNFYEVAFPILRRYGFSATVFVVTGEVGGVSRWDSGSQAELMSWSQLRELHQAGIEVGSHTVSHPRLTQMPVGLAKRQIEDSRDALEQGLGTTVASLAYPYGDWNEIVAQLAKAARYRAACSTVRGNLHWPKELHSLKRIPVDELIQLQRFRHRLSQAYDLTCRIRSLSRRISVKSLLKRRAGG